MCVNAPLPPDATISVQFLGTNVKASPQHVPHPTSSVPTASISGNIVTNTLFRTSQGKNVMADDTSRLTTYSDTALLSHFNHVFPQAQPWQLLRPRNDTFSSVISALRGYRHGIPLLLHNVPPPNNACGKKSGSLSANRSPSIRYSVTHRTKFQCYKFLPSASATADAAEATSPFGLKQWLTNSTPSQRRFATWGPWTPVSTASAPSIFT